MGNELSAGNAINTGEIRRKLLKSRDEILSIASKVHKQIGLRDAPRDPDSAERAIELENLDVLFELDRETRYELRMINDAIERIDAGDYGTCSVCGSRIDSRRLCVIPYIDTCVSCALIAEQGRAASP
jgi:RNA polymerase-binding transcription factor DksA